MRARAHAGDDRDAEHDRGVVGAERESHDRLSIRRPAASTTSRPERAPTSSGGRWSGALRRRPSPRRPRRTSIARTSVRCSSAGSWRVLVICARRSRSSRSTRANTACHVPPGPPAEHVRHEQAEIAERRVQRFEDRRELGAQPGIADASTSSRINSSVTARARGEVAITSPDVHVAISASASSRIRRCRT